DPGLRPNSGIPVQAVAATPHEWLVAGGDFILDHGSVRTTDLAVYRLSASDPGGPGTGGPGAGGTGGGTAGDRTPPVLSGLTASKKRFRVGKLPRRGTRLSFKLSEKAGVSFKAFAVKKG